MHNRFKERLGHELQLGFWLMSASGLVAEAVGGAGFDWLLIDMEHSPNELPMVIDQLRAVRLTGAAPIVRASSLDRVVIKRLLDAGADTIMVPNIQSAAEAREAVAAMRYPPRGVRGYTGMSRANAFGRDKSYAREADGRVCLVLQLETTAALSRLHEIADVEGVDALFIGPADLAVDLGYAGDYAHPEAWPQILEALRAVKRTGRPCGILVGRADQAADCAAAGADFIGLGADLSLLARQADIALAAARAVS
jgi:2-keto-3-deoxy-L-rhamnonate aldolase RhmA